MMPDTQHEFPVIEWRRYTVIPEERAAFAAYFDAYFPEAIQQTGAIVFGQCIEPLASAWREVGLREAGVLVTLDVPNTYPRLPYRTDGPHVVWLGLAADADAFGENLPAPVAQALGAMASMGVLREIPELCILTPTLRSRLRWLPSKPSAIRTIVHRNEDSLSRAAKSS